MNFGTMVVAGHGMSPRSRAEMDMGNDAPIDPGGRAAGGPRREVLGVTTRRVTPVHLPPAGGADTCHWCGVEGCYGYCLDEQIARRSADELGYR